MTMLDPYRIPRATYRLQLNRHFPLKEAIQLVPYLSALGISDLYASPVFEAVRGSLHGYDVTNPTRINPELGTEEEFDQLMTCLKDHEMGLILDVVPNHMGTNDSSNGWWQDVLAEGPHSRYANYFDIDWTPPQKELANKVLLPILNGPLDQVLNQGNITLVWEENRFWIAHFSQRLPLSKESIVLLPEEPPQEATGVVSLSREALSSLLTRQHYQLSDWREAPYKINYRRFFDINTLVGMRVETKEVFEAVHALLFRLIERHKALGLRIDHPDGLRNPEKYFSDLQKTCQTYLGKPCYLVVEKILSSDETLRSSWPVHGTTGYDALNMLNQFFTHSQGYERLEKFYDEFTGDSETWEEALYRSKRLFIETALPGHIRDLSLQLKPLLGEEDALDEIQEALQTLIALFPVYRTYVSTIESVSQEDQDIFFRTLQKAVRKDSKRKILYEKLVSGFLLERGDAEKKAQWFHLITRLQQTTAPVTAKGLEDTLFYRRTPLASINEVGGDPETPTLTLQAFHRQQQERLTSWPYGMMTTTTHDTKRSEDARSRLQALSQEAERWTEAVTRWHRYNLPLKGAIKGREIPSKQEEYLLYQTLVGSYPETGKCDETFVQRIEQYMEKALREAKMHTQWTTPHLPYEEGVRQFVRDVLSPKNRRFLEDFQEFCASVAENGKVYSLSQALLKMTLPGIPDFYQGAELWLYTLVDPDNRGPVDFSYRRKWLDEIIQNEKNGTQDVQKLFRSWKDGRIKLYLLYRTLQFRKRHPDLFLKGAYLPLTVEEGEEETICAFARHHEHHWMVVLVPRGSLQRTAWEAKRVALPKGFPKTARNILTNETLPTTEHQGVNYLPVKALWNILPVAMLEA